MSRVQQFYKGKKIFVTGGTGFLGIILIEKLLRSCPDISTIYFLIREKKGKNIQERVETLLATPAFAVLRDEYPDFARKLVAVPGDIAKERLGLSAEDHARIIDEVSVIFHLAATVRFDEKLEVAVAMNVDSVSFIIDLAKACKNLEAAIYVSTAYSNCPRRTINEEMYPPPLSYKEVQKIVDDLGKKKLSEEQINDFTAGVIKDWPNTYTFTKAIAESVVQNDAKELPVAVFRPSIVTSTYAEPVPGWVATPLGFPGIICGIGVGLIRTFMMNKDAKIDIVPVDYVCNALISCAWETASTRRRPIEDIPVYNYVSAPENPVLCQELMQRIDIFGRLYPTNSCIYYPTVVLTKSRRLFDVWDFLLHLLPAMIVDGIGQLFGKPPRMYKIERKIGNAIRSLGYFSTRGWDFENTRVQNMWKQFGPEDRRIFPFNIRSVDWDEHMMKLIRGLRRYLVGDHDDNLEQSRRRQVYLYIIHTIVRLVFVIFFAWVIWKLYSGFSLGINAEHVAAVTSQSAITNIA